MEYRLENPWALWGLTLVLLYLGRCLWKQKHLKDSFSWRRTLLNSLALLFCIMGLSRPQGGESITTQVSEQSNLFIAIDISQSMSAEDTLPSRMQFAIDFALRLLDQLTQVKIALYPFAIDGYMIMPLSSDLQAAKDLLSSMAPSIATGQGTDLGSTLTELIKQIQRSEKVAKTRGSEWITPQVLLLSDGESHVPVPDSVALSYRNASIPIFTVCIGGKNEVPIPIESRFGIKNNLRDSSGKTVFTTAHPKVLQKIADLSGGSAYRDNFQEVLRLAHDLKRSLQIGKLSTGFKLNREFYPFCFLISFLLLFWDFCLNRWEFAIRLLFLPLLLTNQAHAFEPSDNETQAIEFYNLGVTAYQKEDFKEAASNFEKSILTSLDPLVRKKGLFNLGNTYLKMKESDQALQAYQQSHDTQTPNDSFNQETNQKISDNLALLQKLKEQQKKKKSNEQKEGEGEGEEKNKGNGNDPKGPKQFEDESLSEQMKKKVLDHISEEEREILKRLAENKNRKSNLKTLKPW